jgi:hypothetical protein
MTHKAAGAIPAASFLYSITAQAILSPASPDGWL